MLLYICIQSFTFSFFFWSDWHTCTWKVSDFKQYFTQSSRVDIMNVTHVNHRFAPLQLSRTWLQVWLNKVFMTSCPICIFVAIDVVKCIVFRIKSDAYSISQINWLILWIRRIYPPPPQKKQHNNNKTRRKQSKTKNNSK